MSIGTRQVWAVLAAFAVAFGLAGCAGSDEPAAAPEPKREPAKEAEQTPTPPPPFDECGLLTPEEVAAAEARDGSDGYAVSSRSARPSGDGWNLMCGYADKTLVGVFNSSVETTTEVDPAKFEKQSAGESGVERGKPKPIDDLGDQAYVVSTYRDYTGEKEPWTNDVHVLVGTTSLVMRLGVPDDSERIRDRAVELARTAVDRLPETIEVTPEQVDGPCADIDRELAANVLGEPMAGARGLVGEGDEVSCSFRGERTSLDVTSSSEPGVVDIIDDMASYATELPGVGDQAYASAPPLTDVSILVGDRMISVNAAMAKEQRPRKPKQDELALLQNIADAIG